MSANEFPELKYSLEFWDTEIVGKIQAELCMDGWTKHVEKLSTWNRYSLSSEISHARDYIVSVMKESPNLQVYTEPVQIYNGSGDNIFAFLPATNGTTAPSTTATSGAITVTPSTTTVTSTTTTHTDITISSNKTSENSTEVNVTVTSVTTSTTEIVTTDKSRDIEPLVSSLQQLSLESPSESSLSPSVSPSVLLLSPSVSSLSPSVSSLQHKKPVIVIGGHYDSTSERVHETAPGAIDNASGTAGVMEIARIFAKIGSPVDMMFILYVGEELGYFGSKAHAETHPLDTVSMMLNMDMIGWENPAGSRIQIETVPRYKSLGVLFQESVCKFSSLTSILELHAWGSDHMTYIKKGIPAVLTTNENCETFPHYHTTRDTCEKVSSSVAEQILRTNLGVLAQVTYGGVDLSVLKSSGYI